MPPPSTIDLPAIKQRIWTTTTSHTIPQIIAYNLTLGIHGNSLPHVYESHPEFHPFPTFGTVPTIAVMSHVHDSMQDFLPNFQAHNHIHAEHYLEIAHPYPVPSVDTGNGEVQLHTTAKVLEITAKKNGVLMRVEVKSTDPSSASLICTNIWTSHVLEIPSTGLTFTATTTSPLRSSSQPSRAPDATARHTTNPSQAALYRAASRDLNPLHIDTATAMRAGFPAPLLTGTCTLGIGARKVVERFAGGNDARVRSVEGKLRKPVFAAIGETVRCEMWKHERGIRFVMIAEGKEGDRVVVSDGLVALKCESEVGSKSVL